MDYHISNPTSVEDVLLFTERFMDPTQGGFLWWCESAEDVMAQPINSVCLATLGRWEDVQYCKDWICQYPAVLIVSQNREFIEKVKQHVPWLPLLSVRAGAFGEYNTLAELAGALRQDDLERRIVTGAIVEPSSGLIDISTVKPRDLQSIPRALSGFGKLDWAIGGFRDGELTVWTGKRSEGKSTVLGQILLESVDQGRKVCAYSGELTADRFKKWIITQAAGPKFVSTTKDMQTGNEYYSVSDKITAEIDDWWVQKLYLYDLRMASAHDEDSILNEFEYSRRCLGCKTFLVDNIMTARLKGDRDFYRAQSEFTRRLAEFSKSTGSHVHLVAHPRKTGRGVSVEDSDDVSGTGDITNLADNVISVKRVDDAPDGHTTELAILKSRETGIRGKVSLCFDAPSKRLYTPDSNPNKKYGWEHMQSQEFTEISDSSEFGEVF